MGEIPQAAEGHEPQQSWSRLGLWAGALDNKAVSQARISDKGDLRVVSEVSQARFPKAAGGKGILRQGRFPGNLLAPCPLFSPSWAPCLA